MSTSITITRRLEFDAGHRIVGHESKCANLHGHHYRAEVTVKGSELDSLGRVIDFGVVKERVGSWIDEYWDHNMILHPEDPLLKLPQYGVLKVHEIFGTKDPYIMPPNRSNPTAENMAEELWYSAAAVLSPRHIKVVKVRLYETPNCWADYTPATIAELTADVQQRGDE